MMRFDLQKIFVMMAITLLTGCSADTSNHYAQITPIQYLDCRIKSANAIKIENEKIELVYDPKLDMREGCAERNSNGQ